MHIDAEGHLGGSAFAQPLHSPEWLKAAIPCGPKVSGLVAATRAAIRSILWHRSDRVLVLVGPCSIHDPSAARQYAAGLFELREELSDEIEIVMRAYLEKPRTTVGWKGLINDPFLDGKGSIADGLEIGRGLLEEINRMGLPVGSELLDPLVSRYFDDLLSWGAIGARTTMSAVHRQLASGLSMPVGFKNAVDGSVQVAVDAILAAAHPHTYVSVNDEARLGVVSTMGNSSCHVVLRGGIEPNYRHESVQQAGDLLKAVGLAQGLIVDASHGNSQKNHRRQLDVCADLSEQIASGSDHLVGVMIESHLVAGSQSATSSKPLVYGQSITDACIGWDDTVDVLIALADAVRIRRARQQQPLLAAAN